MRVDRRAVSQLESERLDVAVVIDVLRATSTATTLLSRGVPAIAVVATPADLARLPEARYLIVSELETEPRFGPRLDNSPSRARTVALEGRTPVLVTTNGTRALHAAAVASGRVLVASFRNLAALAAHLGAHPPERVTLLPAGDFKTGEPHQEDELCADALAARLAGEAVDTAAVVARVRSDPRVLRRLSREPALADDLEECLTFDCDDVVPEFSLGAADTGWMRRCA